MFHLKLRELIFASARSTRTLALVVIAFERSNSRGCAGFAAFAAAQATCDLTASHSLFSRCFSRRSERSSRRPDKFFRERVELSTPGIYYVRFLQSGGKPAAEKRMRGAQSQVALSSGEGRKAQRILAEFDQLKRITTRPKSAWNARWRRSVL